MKKSDILLIFSFFAHFQRGFLAIITAKTMPLFAIAATVFLFFSACQPVNQSGQAGKRGQWVSLFNGENLDGWVVKIAGHDLGDNYGNTFRVDNGILSVRYDQYDRFGNQFGALYYKRPLSEYRLKVEYRFVGETAPGGPEWGYRDSGIQYHGQAPETVGWDQEFPVCLEYNLHGGNGVDDRPVGQICANGMTVEIFGKKNESYCTMPQVKRTFHGDQWVTAEIEIRDGQIRHFANGEEILHVTDPRFDPDNSIARLLMESTSDIIKSGYISLQSNSHPIDFRKIELLEY